MGHDKLSPSSPLGASCAAVQLQAPQSPDDEDKDTHASVRLASDATAGTQPPSSGGSEHLCPGRPARRPAGAEPACAPPLRLPPDPGRDPAFPLPHVLVGQRASPPFASSAGTVPARTAVSAPTPGGEPRHTLHALPEGIDLMSLASSHFPSPSTSLSRERGSPGLHEDLFGSHHASELSARERRPASWSAWPSSSSALPREGGADSQLPFLPGLACPSIMATYWVEQRTLVYQLDARGVTVCRRRDNDMVNGTKLLNLSMSLPDPDQTALGRITTRGQRDSILKRIQERDVVRSGQMHYKGVWISLSRARALADECGVAHLIWPILQDDPQPATAAWSTEYTDAAALQAQMAQRRRFSAPSAHPYQIPPSTLPTKARVDGPSAPTHRSTGGHANNTANPPQDALEGHSPFEFDLGASRDSQHGKSKTAGWRKSISVGKPSRLILAEPAAQDAKRRHSSSCLAGIGAPPPAHRTPDRQRQLGHDLYSAQTKHWPKTPSPSDWIPDLDGMVGRISAGPSPEAAGFPPGIARAPSSQASSRRSTGLDLFSSMSFTPVSARDSLSTVATPPSGPPTVAADCTFLWPPSGLPYPLSTDYYLPLETSIGAAAPSHQSRGSEGAEGQAAPVSMADISLLPSTLPLLPTPPGTGGGGVEAEAAAAAAWMQLQSFATTSPPSSSDAAPDGLSALLRQ